MKPVTWRQLRNEQKRAERMRKFQDSGSKAWTVIWTTSATLFSAYMIARLLFNWATS